MAIIQKEAKLEWVQIELLVPIQGNLKSQDEEQKAQLGRSLEDNGIIGTTKVAKVGEIYYIWDGHKRTDYLKGQTILDEQGNDRTGQMYCEVTLCKDKVEAKQWLLLQNSEYGDVSIAGFMDFTADVPPNFIEDYTTLDYLNVPDLNNPFQGHEEGGQEQQPQEGEQQQANAILKSDGEIVFHFSPQEADLVKQGLRSLGTGSLEKLLYEFMQDNGLIEEEEG